MQVGLLGVSLAVAVPERAGWMRVVRLCGGCVCVGGYSIDIRVILF